MLPFRGWDCSRACGWHVPVTRAGLAPAARHGPAVPASPGTQPRQGRQHWRARGYQKHWGLENRPQGLSQKLLCLRVCLPIRKDKALLAMGSVPMEPGRQHMEGPPSPEGHTGDLVPDVSLS